MKTEPETKHTPERKYHAVFGLLRDEDENVVARFERNDLAGLDARAESVRAAACINACAGIENPAEALRKAREAIQGIVANEGAEHFAYLDKRIGTATPGGKRWLALREALRLLSPVNE